jgi:tripartite-type tricarboxylate transporter receptor subunit TctC
MSLRKSSALRINYLFNRVCRLSFILFLACAQSIFAQNSPLDRFPSQPITLILPYAPGGSADVLARAMMVELQQRLGKPIVIEYKAGAGGTIATAALTKSKPDGYTLLMVLSAHVINPALYPSLPYDTRKDFSPITLLARLPQLIVVRSDSPFKTLSDLIAYAKANPGKLSFGSAGNGNTSHLGSEMLQAQAGIKMEHIPYKGSGPVVVAMLGGEIDLMFDSFATSYPQVQAGKFRALGIASARRSPLLPNVPTVAELLPEFAMDGWYGLLAPAGTPKSAVDKLNKVFNEVVRDPKVKAQLIASGYEVVGTTPEQYAKTIEDDLILWSKIVKDSGAKIQ